MKISHGIGAVLVTAVLLSGCSDKQEDHMDAGATDAFALDRGPEAGRDAATDLSRQETAPDDQRVGDAAADQTAEDQSASDGPLLDAPPPDAKLPDQAVADLSLPDLALPDLALPDAALPDAALPDAAQPDATLPDAALPDAAQPTLVCAPPANACAVQQDPASGLSMMCCDPTLPRSSHVIAADGIRAVTFGGKVRIGSTWVWDAPTLLLSSGAWSQAPVMNAVTPSARGGHAMAYDPIAKKLLMFGGAKDMTSNAETWAWDGSTKTWAKLAPNNSPSPCNNNIAMAYDEVGGALMLFGATSGNGAGNETWIFDRQTANWIHLNPSVRPPKRNQFAMAYDANGKHVVLFGGYDSGQANDTWLWNGQAKTWSAASPSNHPTARSNHAMAHDPVRKKTVLFGGWSSATVASLGDTWLWDGTNWTKETPASQPSARSSHAMAFDPVSQRVVLYGGWSGSTALADTWYWNGSNWVQ